MSILLLETAALILCYMLLWWVIAMVVKDNGLADVAWGLGFVLIAWWEVFRVASDLVFVLAILVSCWGLRLSAYIALRNRRKGKEDWRYAAWREQWGKQAWWRSLAQVFLLQGLLLWLISAPLLVAAWCPACPLETGWWTFPAVWIGFLLWLWGWIWESVADWQLYRFKSRSGVQGRIYTGGLWKYSRHPNYFGELLCWWGIWICSLPAGGWWVSLLSPLLISWLLLRVSGVPMLESRYETDETYRRYRQSTPAVFPDFRKILNPKRQSGVD
ncbi:MAG: DUF1295 domain-containing protein [Saprospiraceae bacterium]|nr:DUF1295 domain-containing protein [Saprospiraceae bacterium]